MSREKEREREESYQQCQQMFVLLSLYSQQEIFRSGSVLHLFKRRKSTEVFVDTSCQYNNRIVK